MPFDPHHAASPPAPLGEALARAVAAIPPAWPLAATVAVNPFLGQAGEALAVAAARLGRVAGERATMPRSWYAARIAAGEITEADLAAALAAAPEVARPADAAALMAALAAPGPAPVALPTVADLVAEATGTDWPGIIAERIGAFAGGWFDEGQAPWPAPDRGSLYRSWRAAALRDLTPEILGLGGFCGHVAAAPAEAEAASARALAALGVPEAARETLLHRLLATLIGWAQLARRLGFEAELAGGTDATAAELLAVRLVWEEALFARHAETIGARWAAVLAAHAAPVTASADDAIDAILQEAAERAAQRGIAAALSAPAPAAAERPRLQAVFCIDVRSEVFRRALESLDPAIRTHGFAGFFGLTAAHRPFASDLVENRLPVLLRPGVMTCTAVAPEDPRTQRVRIAARARRAWGRFSQAAVSSFAFVESAGLLHAAGLLRDSFGLSRAGAAAEPAPRIASPLTAAERIGTAETVLRAMSLTAGFAPLVLLAGHGAEVRNNPHASALHCGACGGYRGDVSARLVASLLNDAEVRAGLAGRGIAVPEDTLFVAALHDTTTDRVTLFDADPPSAAHAASHAASLAVARDWLARAGALARAERALRLPRAGSGDALPRRSRDWAETRPEWALAGCRAFIAAPRSVTAGRDLGGRAFLHDYDWRKDEGFPVLELILTAPVVVASWISLQYYGSVTAPGMFGGGNKVLHNVTGGVGVVEGNGGVLRTGLPWQSVHDGEGLAHEPLRLTVVIAAPREAIDGILDRHAGVRALFDNRWLHLFAQDDGGRLWRYRAVGEWTEEEAAAPGRQEAERQAGRQEPAAAA